PWGRGYGTLRPLGAAVPRAADRPNRVTGPVILIHCSAWGGRSGMNLTQLLIPAEPLPPDLGWDCPTKLDPAMDGERLDITGCDYEHLGVLWGLLRGQVYGGMGLGRGLGEFGLGSENTAGGPWLTLLPPDFTARLAALDGPRIAQVAEAWGRSEYPPECEGDHNGEPRGILPHMARMAAEALARTTQLLL